MKVPPTATTIEGEEVSPHLPPLLAAVYTEVVSPEPDLGALQRALEALLVFLSSSAGRTNANCVAADHFFMLNDRWERDWEHLPDQFQDILGMLGDALHDTVSAPEVAENFDNTPEQLLRRLRQIRIN